MTYNLKDYAHASRLFLGGNYRLLPKTSFLFHAFIDVQAGSSSYDAANPNSNREIGLMVKQADLPRFTSETKTLHSYNRPNIVQTKIKYDPVNIIFHDDNSNVVRNFWIKYFKHYFRDSDYSLNQHNLPYVYTNQLFTNFGLDPRSPNHYLRSVRLYTLHQKKFTEYIFVNPIIKTLRFGTHNKQSTDEILQTEMTIEYEAVLYQGGTVTYSNPPGFADLHYDYSKSPLQKLQSLFGDNGLNGTKNLQQLYASPSSLGASQYNTTLGLSSARSAQINNSSVIDMTNIFNSMLQQNSSSRVLVPNLAGSGAFQQGPFTGIGVRSSTASLPGASTVISTSPQLTSRTKISEISQSSVTSGLKLSNFIDTFPPDNTTPTTTQSTISYPSDLKILNDVESNPITGQVEINLIQERRRINNRIEFLEKAIVTLVDVVNATNEQVNISATTYNTLNQKYIEAKNLPDQTTGKQELITQLEGQIDFQLDLIRDNTDVYNKKMSELSELTNELEELKARRDSIQ